MNNWFLTKDKCNAVEKGQPFQYIMLEQLDLYMQKEDYEDEEEGRAKKGK